MPNLPDFILVFLCLENCERLSGNMSKTVRRFRRLMFKTKRTVGKIKEIIQFNTVGIQIH